MKIRFYEHSENKWSIESIVIPRQGDYVRKDGVLLNVTEVTFNYDNDSVDIRVYNEIQMVNDISKLISSEPTN